MEHFENLWEEAEKVLAEETNISSNEEIIGEVSSKLNLYKTISGNIHTPSEEKSRLLSYMFGKILLSLTQLSFKDEINVFTALKTSLDTVKIQQLENKYK